MTTTWATTSALVPVTKHGVMTAAPGHRLHVVLAHRAEQVLAEAAAAMITPGLAVIIPGGRRGNRLRGGVIRRG